MERNLFYSKDLETFSPQEILEIIGHPEEIDYPDSAGETLLNAACENVQFEYIQYCLQHGADPNHVSQITRHSVSYGKRPLPTLLFATAQHTDRSALLAALMALVAAGADPELSGVYDESPLQLTCSHLQTDCMEFLIAQGVELNKLNVCGESALAIAIDQGNIAAVETLLKAGADTETRSNDVALTPFMLACCRDSLGIIQLLIDYGCDTRATCRDGGIPFDATYLPRLHNKPADFQAFVQAAVNSGGRQRHQ